MKFVNISAFIFFFSLTTSGMVAQSTIQSISAKKGEILDILLLNTKKGVEQHFEKYKETAFPIAIKKTYQPLSGFGISETIQGNLQPTVIAFGKWNDLKNREQFIKEIDDLVPDFHQQRRTIWSLFNLTYYELPTDVSFSIDKNKYNVVTSYWKKDPVAFKAFRKKWLQKSTSEGGKNILQLAKGKSPMGYYHNPDLLIITQWDRKEDFDAFHKQNLTMNHEGVLHVNQFVLN